jgi:UDP-glucose 4-epimerase
MSRSSPSTSYLRKLANCLESLDRDELDRGIELIRVAWQEGRQIITLGNGGSAMTALHFITDWNKMTHLATGKPFRGRTLLDNVGMITAYGNDLSYADIFAEQIKNIAVPGDLVIAISGSGNSENVIRAVTVANDMGCQTLGLCGFSGGRLKSVAKYSIWVNSQDMQLCEDAHATFGHVVMKSLCSSEQMVEESAAGLAAEREARRALASVQIVTGGAGFIGTHLINALIDRGCEVIALDNLVRGNKAYLDAAVRSGRCTLIETDCSDLKSVRSAVGDALEGRTAGAIWHLAANSDIPAGVANPQIDLRDTFMTTFNALQVMKHFSIPDFHFASSSAVYGNFGDLEISEESGPYQPISNYGAMKLASEGQISAAFEDYPGRASIFRFPNVVGSPATHGAIHDFVNKLKADPSCLPVLGNGTQQKVYLHVSDLISAMLFIAESGRGKINIYNIGPRDAGVTVRFIAECVRDIVSPSAGIVYGEGDRGWIGDVPRFRYDTRRLAELGWKPSMSSADAVRVAIRDIVRTNWPVDSTVVDV